MTLLNLAARLVEAGYDLERLPGAVADRPKRRARPRRTLGRDGRRAPRMEVCDA